VPYVGNSNQVQNFTPAVDYFNGNGSTTSFTLSRTVGSSFDIQAFIENVPQNPSSAFTVAGNVITFTSAPPSGTNNIYVRYTSPVVQLVKPAPGTVGTAEISSSVTLTTPLISGNLNFDSTGTSGIRLPSANTLAFHTAGTEDMRIDSSGNMGIGTSSPSEKLEINNGNLAVGNAVNNFTMKVSRTGTNASSVVVGAFTNEPDIQWTYTGSGALRFTDSTAGAERMRIDSNGKFLLNKTTSNMGCQMEVKGINPIGAEVTTVTGTGLQVTYNLSSGLVYWANFTYNGSNMGSITSSGSSTAYNTGSDYRLKENIASMTGALAKVTQLKPSTWTWKRNGSDGQGFIAHELAEVVPDCVTGEKDAVDSEGKPVYQGIDTSFLVATLTAAIQEQQAIIEDLKTRIEILENK